MRESNIIVEENCNANRMWWATQNGFDLFLCISNPFKSYFHHIMHHCFDRIDGMDAKSGMLDCDGMN